MKWYGWSALGLVVLDQAVKYLLWVMQPDITLGFLRVHVVLNTGISFSWFSQNNWLFFWIGLIIIGGFLYYYDQLPKKTRKWTWFIGAGAASNLIDRVVMGGVIDYFDISWFAIFNIADSMITVGALLFIIYSFAEEKRNKKPLPKGRGIH